MKFSLLTHARQSKKQSLDERWRRMDPAQNRKRCGHEMKNAYLMNIDRFSALIDFIRTELMLFLFSFLSAFPFEFIFPHKFFAHDEWNEWNVAAHTVNNYSVATIFVLTSYRFNGCVQWRTYEIDVSQLTRFEFSDVSKLRYRQNRLTFNGMNSIKTQVIYSFKKLSRQSNRNSNYFP